MKFHTSAASGLKSGQSDQKRNFYNVSYEIQLATDSHRHTQTNWFVNFPPAGNCWIELWMRPKEGILSIFINSKDRAQRFHPSIFDSAELVAGCGSFVLKSIKRSVINIGRSMLDVRCSTFKAFSPPLEDSLFRPGGVSYERRRWPKKRPVWSEKKLWCYLFSHKDTKALRLQ